MRAWTIRQGTKAPQAAGTIHTDFEKGFQSADIYSFKSLKQNDMDEKVKDKPPDAFAVELLSVCLIVVVLVLVLILSAPCHANAFCACG